MKKTAQSIAFECLFDLGVTVVYAVFVGMMVVGIVAADSGPISLLKAVAYASLLPGAVVALIVVDFTLRLVSESRAARRRFSSPIPARG